MKGLLKKTEARHAFTVMKRNHMPGGMLGIDDFYLENGYYADNAGITIEIFRIGLSRKWHSSWTTQKKPLIF